MNKYQEALNRLCENDYFDEKGNCDCDLVELDRELTQKLVDKEMPKKPIITIINKKYGSYQCDCPACGRFISVNCKDITTVYCPECGQRIDWKD